MAWLIEPIAAETNAHSPKTAQSGTQLSSYKVPKRIEFRTLLPKQMSERSCAAHYAMKCGQSKSRIPGLLF